MVTLTKRQNEIVWKLQNGWVFVTGEDFGAFLCKGNTSERITLGVFFNLVKKEIISQDASDHFNYNLTPHLGIKIKTTKPKSETN